jgi:alcohol dehydrogenase (cytochrome c)
MKIMRPLAIVSLLALPLGVTAQGPLDPALLLKPPTDAWPSYHGDYTGRHYSPLKQVNVTNARNLSLAWFHRVPASTDGAIVGGADVQPGGRGGAAPAQSAGGPVIKAMPLMVNGILYFSSPNRVFSVDARTGRLLWQYLWRGRNAIGNRGVAMYGNSLVVVAPDNTVVSLDAVTGKERWNRKLTGNDVSNWSTSAPIVIRNHVLVGIGGDTPTGSTRGFLESLDPDTGASQWKWWATPGAGEPGIETWPNVEASLKSSGAPWQPPTYDPELNLVYVTTGQATPTYNGKSREGANLYTSSVVALNADTGKMAWYYQFSPHDTHDWDSNQDMVLVDRRFRGEARKLLLHADRNGHFYVLDRTNGTFLAATPFTTQTWSTGFDAGGRPIAAAGSQASAAGSVIAPSIGGATNFQAPSYSPATGLFYLAFQDGGQRYFTDAQPYEAGRQYPGGRGGSSGQPRTFGVKAIDPEDGHTVWSFPLSQGSLTAGVLATAGGVVFASSREGFLFALDARTGATLWKFQTGAAIDASPISYAAAGKQFVAVSAGNVVYSFALPEP